MRRKINWHLAVPSSSAIKNWESIRCSEHPEMRRFFIHAIWNRGRVGCGNCSKCPVFSNSCIGLKLALKVAIAGWNKYE